MQKAKVLISEKRSIHKFFKSSEIKSIEPLNRKFTIRKKIAVYTPAGDTELVAEAMHKAGAGVIGNYEKCSFRIEGLGTYRPNKKANPHSGKRGELSRVKETLLSMECSGEILNDVLDAMLSAHPYEETAYEVYDFAKRENVSDGSVVTLRKAIHYPELLLRINRKVSPAEAKSIYKKKNFKKIVMVDGKEDDKYLSKSRSEKADAVIFVDKRVNLIII